MKMRCALILCAQFYFFHPSFADEIFNPKNCEFTVSFPGKYDIQEIFSSTGQSIHMAKTTPGQPTKLSAECWPQQAISPQEYAKALSPKMADRGIKVHSVSLGKGYYGEIVTLAGSAGEGPDKYYIRFESFFGTISRLDLLVLEKSPVASKEHLAFRNSVRLK